MKNFGRVWKHVSPSFFSSPNDGSGPPELVDPSSWMRFFLRRMLALGRQVPVLRHLVQKTAAAQGSSEEVQWI